MRLASGHPDNNGSQPELLAQEALLVDELVADQLLVEVGWRLPHARVLGQVALEELLPLVDVDHVRVLSEGGGPVL